MSYRALYRKYRPRLFADIVGQPGIVQALTGQVDSGRISHAYLFSGPRGTGKTSAAKVLARAINCAAPVHGEACGVCRPCQELMGDTNMDVIEIDAASNNSVDKVREMLENVKYMPAVGKYRVYIVDEVHMLSASAFNALLKTLEEPPAHVVFILATTEPHKLPATVLSRCQQFQFRRISAGAMTDLLIGVLKSEAASADREALQAIARASDGGMRDALSLLDQCLSLTGSHVTKTQVQEMLGTADSSYFFTVAECMLSGDAGGAVDRLDQFINSGGDIKTFATDLCRHMRDLFIATYVKESADILDVSGEEASLLAVQAARFAAGDILKALGILSELEGGLRYAANPRVLVELALFRCCRVEKEMSYESLMTRVERLEARLESGQPLPAVRVVPETPIRADVHIQPKAEPQAPPKSQPQPAAAPVQSKEPQPEVPWFDDEPPKKGINSVTSLDGRLNEDAGFMEEAIPAEPVQEHLPGQMDLFAGMGGEGIANAPAPVHQHPDMQPGKFWSMVQAQMPSSLQGFANKGKATAYDGATLTITFTEDSKGSVGMLEEPKRMARLNAIVDSVAGHHVAIRLEISQWSPAQQQFIERSRALIPKDATMIIEKE